MRKRHVIVGAAVVTVGSVVFWNQLRAPGDAAGPTVPRMFSVNVSDRCGELVRESDGSPMVLQFRVDPPPIEDAVSNEAGVELVPPTEGIQVGVYLPADPRKASDVSFDCLRVTGRGGA